MPFVNVKLVEGVFTPEEKHAMAKALTDVMVKFEGSEAFREVVWVLIEELHTDGWHIGGRPFEGPKSLMTTLSKSKDIVAASACIGRAANAVAAVPIKTSRLVAAGIGKYSFEVMVLSLNGRMALRGGSLA